VEPLGEKVAAFIQANALFGEPARVLLAVSGGADSIALLHVMHTLTRQSLIGADLFCIHINHQLRGDDSQTDAAFVAEQAEKLGIPCDIKTVDIRAYAEKHHLSIETAARQIRLDCFVETAQRLGCNWVATGHQMNDNAETVLQRLRRGTGFRGLRGIQPARPLYGSVLLARPLLPCTRDEIVSYLQSRGLQWREDKSNTDCTYTRNLIRHRLLPTLQREASGSLVDELADLAFCSAMLYDRIHSQAEKVANQSVESSGDRTTIDTQALATLAEPIATELIRMQLVRLGCGERDLTDRHYAAILELIRADHGSVSLPGGYTARRDTTKLILVGAGPCACPPTPESVELPIPGEVAFADCTIKAETFERKAGLAFEIPADKTEFIEYLDLDRVGQPLIVRTRRPGDSFWPLGLKEPKKIGKFLTTAKVPTERRVRIILFDDGQKIVWVCPVRISEQVKVTERTQRVLILRVE
jgi:tRNA(Ile)-lysidine synthase